MKIFISYSTSNKRIVREIAKSIPSSIYTWIDHKTIDGGNILQNKIKKGIKESDIFFLFISKESVSSKWVKKEIQWALDKEKKDKSEFIIPIVLDEEVWNTWKNRRIKTKKYILLDESKEIHTTSNEIKDSILGVAIQNRNDCIYKKDIYNNVMASFFLILALFAFFNTPSRKDHLEYLDRIGINLSQNLYFEDMYLFSYTTSPSENSQRKILTVGCLGLISFHEIKDN